MKRHGGIKMCGTNNPVQWWGRGRERETNGMNKEMLVIEAKEIN